MIINNENSLDRAINKVYHELFDDYITPTGLRYDIYRAWLHLNKLLAFPIIKIFSLEKWL